MFGRSMKVSPEKQKGRCIGTFPLSISGAGNESRTRDLNLGKVALYQLSYSRKYFWRREPESNRPTRICNPVHNRFAIAPLVWPDFPMRLDRRNRSAGSSA